MKDRDEKYEQAYKRMDDLGFSEEETDFIFADWPNADEHISWLLSATREEIVSWIEAGK